MEGKFQNTKKRKRNIKNTYIIPFVSPRLNANVSMAFNLPLFTYLQQMKMNGVFIRRRRLEIKFQILKTNQEDNAFFFVRIKGRVRFLILQTSYF